MKRQITATAAALVLALAGTGGAFAQAKKTTGTETGTDTSTTAAGTGNAGDKTIQPGSKTDPPARYVLKSKRARRAASAASSRP
jgi:hypothetical protein